MRKPLYYNIDLEATGENISRLRKVRGMTVRDIQFYMGLEMPRVVYKWERGQSLPSLEHLMALGRLFDLRIEEILVWNCPL